MIVRLLIFFLNILGYNLAKKGTDRSVADIVMDNAFMELYQQCKPYQPPPLNGCIVSTRLFIMFWIIILKVILLNAEYGEEGAL